MTTPPAVQRPSRIRLFNAGLAIILAMLSACQQQTNNGSLLPADTQAIYLPEASATSVPTPAPATQQTAVLTWIDPAIPAGARDQISSAPTIQIAADAEDAQIRISIANPIQLGTWTYLAAVPFRSFQTDISSTDLRSLWRATEPEAGGYQKIFLSQETYDLLSLVWGDPGGELLEFIKPGDLLEGVWSNPDHLVILPFEELTVDWKVLTVDGIDPFAEDFREKGYSLNIPIMIDLGDLPPEALPETGWVTNFDPDKFTSLALTGVTALVRDTAAIMEEQGLTYPALDIQDILKNASITHISNEVPFAEDCPPPDPNQESLYFCSADKYIELLEAVGTDIVELSGDHFGDWGPEAMLHSIDLYHERGWLTYGGGETLQKGLDPVFIEHNGNSFAFIGCNGKVHASYATASATNPGASRCDFEWMVSEIEKLVQEGYLVIATMQHEEVDSFNPIAVQLYDFGRLAAAGPAIVSGSQAHHPQSFSYDGRTFIHYGLGNLFFDQWYLANYNPAQHVNKDKAFLDLHYFYNGSHINTRLISLQFIDNARPRLMDPEETAAFLSDVFEFAVWRNKPLIPFIWY